MLFTSEQIGRFDNTPLLDRLSEVDLASKIPDLKTVCLIRGDSDDFIKYDEFVAGAESIPEHILDIFDGIISPHDVANLQFTSGSTSNPKAAMLTHQYVQCPDPRLLPSLLWLTTAQQPCQQRSLHR
jgi:acyl-CoA synthetase (AMP-forming)/AMP-acid ligase II